MEWDYFPIVGVGGRSPIEIAEFIHHLRLTANQVDEVLRVEVVFEGFLQIHWFFRKDGGLITEIFLILILYCGFIMANSRLWCVLYSALVGLRTTIVKAIFWQVLLIHHNGLVLMRRLNDACYCVFLVIPYTLLLIFYRLPFFLLVEVRAVWNGVEKFAWLTLERWYGPCLIVYWFIWELPHLL